MLFATAFHTFEIGLRVSKTFTGQSKEHPRSIPGSDAFSLAVKRVYTTPLRPF